MNDFLSQFPIVEGKYVEDNNTLYITLANKDAEISYQIKEKIWKEYKHINIKISYE
jgi:hypothetical protein